MATRKTSVLGGENLRRGRREVLYPGWKFTSRTPYRSISQSVYYSWCLPPSYHIFRYQPVRVDESSSTPCPEQHRLFVTCNQSFYHPTNLPPTYAQIILLTPQWHVAYTPSFPSSSSSSAPSFQVRKWNGRDGWAELLRDML